MSTLAIKESTLRPTASQSAMNQEIQKMLNYIATEHVVEVDRSWYEGDDTELANDFDIATYTSGAGTVDMTTTAGNLTMVTAGGGTDTAGLASNAATLYRSRNPRLEAAITLAQTADTEFYFGIYKDADEYAYIYFDKSNDANWHFKIEDTTAAEDVDLGVAADTDQITLTLEISDGTNDDFAGAAGTPHVWLNGTKIDVTAAANLVTADGHKLYMVTGEEAAAAKTATCQGLTVICNRVDN